LIAGLRSGAPKRISWSFIKGNVMYRSMGKHAASVLTGVVLCIAGGAVADEPQEGTAATSESETV
jgi:hypothetical protein